MTNEQIKDITDNGVVVFDELYRPPQLVLPILLDFMKEWKPREESYAGIDFSDLTL